MSRHQFHVATSFLPTVGFPGRDLPHCHPCRDLKNDVATSSRPSKLPTLSQPQNSRLQLGFSCHDTKNDVATPTPSSLGCDAKRCRDLALSGPGHARVAQVVGARWRCRARSRLCPAHLLPSCHDLNTRS